MKLSGLILVGVTVSVAGVSLALSQMAAANASPSVASAGVFTAAQAAHGKTLYTQSCASCHGDDLGGVDAPPLTGADFLSRWSGQSVGDLYTQVDKMPPDSAGALGASGDTDVVAYILSANHYASGNTALPADAATLKAIKLDKPK